MKFIVSCVNCLDLDRRLSEIIRILNMIENKLIQIDWTCTKIKLLLSHYKILDLN